MEIENFSAGMNASPRLHGYAPFSECYKICDNVTEVMKLPCVLSCEKQFSFDEKGRVVCELIYRLDNVLVRDPGIDSPVVAKKGNWLCCSHGVWWLLSDYEKQKMTDYGN